MTPVTNGSPVDSREEFIAERIKVCKGKRLKRYGKNDPPGSMDTIEGSKRRCAKNLWKARMRTIERNEGKFKRPGDTPAYKHPLFSMYTSMLARCSNENFRSYEHYGGRGIKVCDRWRTRPEGFWNFIQDMGERPSGCSLDRIDVNGNYEPSNCRWASPVVQHNNKRSNIYVNVGGIKLSMKQACIKLGISYNAVKLRRSRGYTAESAIAGVLSKKTGGTVDIEKIKQLTPDGYGGDFEMTMEAEL